MTAGRWSALPVLNGLQAAKRLQAADSQAKIIFLTVYESPDFVDAGSPQNQKWPMKAKPEALPAP